MSLGRGEAYREAKFHVRWTVVLVHETGDIETIPMDLDPTFNQVQVVTEAMRRRNRYHPGRVVGMEVTRSEE